MKAWLGKLGALRKDPRVAYTGLALVLAASGANAYWLMSGEELKPGPIEMGYYYDLNSGELFVEPWDMAPPIEAPSGPLPDGRLFAGVRARVFGCGSCEDTFVAYLEKFRADVKRALEDPEAVPRPEYRDLDQREMADKIMGDATQGLLGPDAVMVRRPEAGSPWVGRFSEAGRAIARSAYEQCDQGQRVAQCEPAPAPRTPARVRKTFLHAGS